MESVSSHVELPGEDVRLFSEEEYPFDVIGHSKIESKIIALVCMSS